MAQFIEREAKSMEICDTQPGDSIIFNHDRPSKHRKPKSNKKIAQKSKKKVNQNTILIPPVIKLKPVPKPKPKRRPNVANLTAEQLSELFRTPVTQLSLNCH